MYIHVRLLIIIRRPTIFNIKINNIFEKIYILWLFLKFLKW